MRAMWRVRAFLPAAKILNRTGFTSVRLNEIGAPAKSQILGGCASGVTAGLLTRQAWWMPPSKRICAPNSPFAAAAEFSQINSLTNSGKNTNINPILQFMAMMGRKQNGPAEREPADGASRRRRSVYWPRSLSARTVRGRAGRVSPVTETGFEKSR